MDSISKDLALIPVKRGGVLRAFEQAHAEASTLFEFSFQWKDLDDHFDSVAGSLKEQFESLKAWEASLEERARVVETKEKELEPSLQRVAELEREIRIKEERLATVQQRLQNVVNSLEERAGELGFLKQERVEMEKKLLSVEESLNRCCSQLETKKKELDRVVKSMEEFTKLVQVKEEQKTGNEETAKLKRRKMACSVEEDYVSVELELKREELKLSVANWEMKLKLKEEKHAEILKSITESSIVLRSKELELRSLLKRREETCIELELIRRRAAGVNALLEDRTRIAQMRERDIEERERQFHFQQQQQQHHLQMTRMPVLPWRIDSYGSPDLQRAVPEYGPSTTRNFRMP